MSDIDFETIQSAMQSMDKDFSVESFEKYDSGRARDVFLVKSGQKEELVLYLCTDTGEYEERFKKEEKLIEIVNRKTDIPTQNILYSDFSKETVPFLFYIAEKVEGYNPIDKFKYLSRDGKKHVVRMVGRYLGELHKNVQFENSGEIRYVEGKIEVDEKKWRDFIKNRAEEKLEEIEKTKFSDLTEKIKDFVERNLELAEQEVFCCLHWDITPDNIIIENEEINAVIDWEKAISGPPEWDLAYSRVQMIYRWFEDDKISKELEEQFFLGYKEEIQLDDGWKQDVIFYDMIQSIGAMADFPKWTKDMDEQEKKDEEEFFRTLFEKRYENLEEAAEKEIHL